MAADTPIVVYDRKKEKKHTKKSMDELADRWAAMHGEKMTGRKINLSDYMNNNILDNK
jgi:hypothetical protein